MDKGQENGGQWKQGGRELKQRTEEGKQEDRRGRKRASCQAVGLQGVPREGVPGRVNAA